MVSDKSNRMLHMGLRIYRLARCIKSIRVVFSMDLTITRVLGVIGELASFNGLKLRTALRILLAVPGRLRIKMDRQFKVASTSNTSLSSWCCG